MAASQILAVPSHRRLGRGVSLLLPRGLRLAKVHAQVSAPRQRFGSLAALHANFSAFSRKIPGLVHPGRFTPASPSARSLHGISHMETWTTLNDSKPLAWHWRFPVRLAFPPLAQGILQGKSLVASRKISFSLA